MKPSRDLAQTVERRCDVFMVLAEHALLDGESTQQDGPSLVEAFLIDVDDAERIEGLSEIGVGQVESSVLDLEELGEDDEGFLAPTERVVEGGDGETGCDATAVELLHALRELLRSAERGLRLGVVCTEVRRPSFFEARQPLRVRGTRSNQRSAAGAREGSRRKECPPQRGCLECRGQPPAA